MPAPILYIDNQVQLRQAIEACLEVSVVTIDTEFARYNTYYPIVGLIQVYDGRTCYLIDPLGIEDLTPLVDLLEANNVLKIFHACSEDMEVFQYCLNTLPTPVFDSQIAAAALGIGFSISYQNLVSHHLSITVPKEETRSDWLQRPLTEGQLKYAALDVIYLLQVYEMQRDQLQEMQREEWVTEDSALLSVDLPTMVEPDSAYKKLKGLAKLNRKQLSVLQALCSWRETRARETNVPRNRIVDQKSLISIAGENILEKNDLQAIAEMSPRQVRKFGEDLLFLAEEAKRLPEDKYPPLVPRDGARIDSKKLGDLRGVVQSRAKFLGVSPELLTKRRHLEALLRSSDGNGNHELPEGLSGWRKEAIGNDLIEALRE
jgi:ribonuclease D